jgi:hypothetical protein
MHLYGLKKDTREHQSGALQYGCVVGVYQSVPIDGERDFGHVASCDIQPRTITATVRGTRDWAWLLYPLFPSDVRPRGYQAKAQSHYQPFWYTCVLSSLLSDRALIWGGMSVRVEVTVKVKANMPFKKIFEVAEVCITLYVLLHAHCFHLSLRNASARIQVRSTTITA